MCWHGWKQQKTFGNDEKSTFFVMHTRGLQRKNLLISNWEWLPKAGRHPKADYSLGILLFFALFSTWTLMCMTQKTKFQKVTSFWESLPIADQQTFFLVFLHKPLVCLSCAWWKRYFFIMFFVIAHVFAGRNTQHLLYKTCFYFVDNAF